MHFWEASGSFDLRFPIVLGFGTLKYAFLYCENGPRTGINNCFFMGFHVDPGLREPLKEGDYTLYNDLRQCTSDLDRDT